MQLSIFIVGDTRTLKEILHGMKWDMQIFLTPISTLKESNDNLPAPHHLAFYCSNNVTLLNVSQNFYKNS